MKKQQRIKEIMSVRAKTDLEELRQIAAKFGQTVVVWTTCNPEAIEGTDCTVPIYCIVPIETLDLLDTTRIAYDKASVYPMLLALGATKKKAG